VKYILTLLVRLYDAEKAEQANIRNLILDSVAGEIELRSKRELSRIRSGWEYVVAKTFYKSLRCRLSKR